LRGSFQKTDWLQGGGAPFLVQDSGRTLANVLFIWHNLWVRFRLKVSGPDKETAKETKEFIEKYFAHNDPPKK
jgi:hypothetical protein